MDIISRIAAYDTQFFLIVNSLHNGFFDRFMMAFSNMKVWIPFYVVVVYLLFRSDGRRAIWLVLFLAICIVLSDQLSVLVKNLVERPRPTHNAIIGNFVHIVNNYKGGPFGFVSSHAANTVSFAVLSALFIRRNIYTVSVFLWVFITCYSRVYLGVHYPLDIVGGLLLGVFTAILVFTIFRKFKADSIPHNLKTINPAIIVLYSTVLVLLLYSAL